MASTTISEYQQTFEGRHRPEGWLSSLNPRNPSCEKSLATARNWRDIYMTMLYFQLSSVHSPFLSLNSTLNTQFPGWIYTLFGLEPWYNRTRRQSLGLKPKRGIECTSSDDTLHWAKQVAGCAVYAECAQRTVSTRDKGLVKLSFTRESVNRIRNILSTVRRQVVELSCKQYWNNKNHESNLNKMFIFCNFNLIIFLQWMLTLTRS